MDEANEPFLLSDLEFPPSDITFPSPGQTPFKFESPVRGAGARNIFYPVVSSISSVLAPPKFTKELLQRRQGPYPNILRDGMAEHFRDNPGLFVFTGVEMSLALFVPMTLFVLLCLHRRKKAAVGDFEPQGLAYKARRKSLRTIFIATLGLMLITIACAFSTTFYIFAGIPELDQQMHRGSRDTDIFLKKSSHEVTFLFVDNYRDFDKAVAKALSEFTLDLSAEFITDVGSFPIINLRNIEEGLTKVSQETQALQKSMRKLNDNLRAYRKYMSDHVYRMPYLSGECLKLKTLLKAAVNDCLSIRNLTTVMKNIGGDTTTVPDIKDRGDRIVQLLDRPALPLHINKILKERPLLKSFMENAAKRVKGIKNKVKDVGRDLKALSSTFNAYMDPKSLTLKHVVSNLATGFARMDPQPLLCLSVFGILAVNLLGFVMGLVLSERGSNRGFFSHYWGSRSLLFNTCLMAFLFGVVMLSSATSLLLGFAWESKTCAVIGDLSVPAARDLVRYVADEVREKDNHTAGTASNSSGSGSFFDHVNTTTMTDILQHFTRCDETSCIFYKLLGDHLALSMGDFLKQTWDIRWLVQKEMPATFDHSFARFGKVRLAEINNATAQTVGQILTSITSIPFGDINLNVTPDSVNKIKAMFGMVINETRETFITLTTLTQKVDPGVVHNVSDFLNETNSILSVLVNNASSLLAVTDGFKTNIASLIKLAGPDGKILQDFVDAEVKIFNRRLNKTYDNISKFGSVPNFSYKSQLMGLYEAYVNHVRGEVKERVGDLKPLYDVYHAFVDALCPGLVGPVNAFWLSITVYLLLSIPAMILALKLAAVYSKLKAPVEVPVTTDELMSQPFMHKGMHGVSLRRAHSGETSQLPKASEEFLSSAWHTTIPSTTTFSRMRSSESGLRSSAYSPSDLDTQQYESPPISWTVDDQQDTVEFHRRAGYQFATK